MSADGRSTTVTIGDGTTIAVTATNAYEKERTALGGFSLTKEVAGVDAGTTLPSFTFDYAYTDADGTSVSGEKTIAAGESFSVGSLPVGTTVTLSEATPAAIEGYTFKGVAFTGEGIATTANGEATFTIGDGTTIAVTATNAYEKERARLGAFSITKALSGVDDTTTGFTFDYTINGVTAHATLTAGETFTATGLPVGTAVTISEPAPARIEGYAFAGVAFTGGDVSADGTSTTVTIGDGTTVAVTATNTYEKTGLRLARTGSDAQGALGLVLPALLGGAVLMLAAGRRRG